MTMDGRKDRSEGHSALPFEGHDGHSFFVEHICEFAEKEYVKRSQFKQKTRNERRRHELHTRCHKEVHKKFCRWKRCSVGVRHASTIFVRKGAFLFALSLSHKLKGHGQTHSDSRQTQGFPLVGRLVAKDTLFDKVLYCLQVVG